MDTNIVLAQLTESPVAALAEQQGINAPEATVMISMATVGEIHALALKRGWGAGKQRKLRNALNKLTVLDIAQPLVTVYAEIDAYSQGRLAGRPLGTSARNMGKNDLWIAATASLTNATLVTTDKDFDHLDGEFATVVKRLDPRTSA